MGGAPGLAAPLAGGLILLDWVLSSDFYKPLPAPEEMARDLSAILARAEDEQDILDAARRWANDRRFQVGVQQLKLIWRPSEAAGSRSQNTPASPPALSPPIAH